MNVASPEAVVDGEPSPHPAALAVVTRCAGGLSRKVRYVFDTLFSAAAIPVIYADEAPSEGPWLLYAERDADAPTTDRCLRVDYDPMSWTFLDKPVDLEAASDMGGLPVVMPQGCRACAPGSLHIGFDLIANAFYFLSSFAERRRSGAPVTRQLFANSVFARLGIGQHVVDCYLQRVLELLSKVCESAGWVMWPPLRWPQSRSFAVVLTHDVDFLSSGFGSIAVQGGKTLLRHLVRQRDPADAMRAAAGWLRAFAHRRDPYSCVPEIIAEESRLGVRSSFQVAVGHRHPNDVNYRIEDDQVRDYLRAIPDSGFDLCLHGSYRSTEDAQWYLQEAELLARRLERPTGSRQHFLSFDYDTLFSAQERAGIAYDMSMGFPDQPGPRAGFSHPYFPYCLDEDRPYRVLQISLFLMDVTLRGYLGLRAQAARGRIEHCIADLAQRGGCASVVWHPIVFGGARDPGFGELYFEMVRHILARGGLATDGRTVNQFWRAHTRRYDSFADL